MADTQSSDNFDLVVIGAGPGGYVCAIRAAQLGLKTACVDKRGRFGGTCLNVGCIPSKALLHSSELFEKARHEFAGMGIIAKDLLLDLPAMLAQKDKGVDTLTKGIEFLFKKNKIEGITGTARITAPGQVEILGKGGSKRQLAARNIVIASGSEPASLPGIDIDEKCIVSSTGALSLEKVPGRLAVIGAGYIGLELGSVWRRLGSEVTVVEFLDRVTPGLDEEVSKQFKRSLQKQGIKFRLSTKVNGVSKAGNALKITVENLLTKQEENFEADVVLISVGRKPFTDGLGLKEIGVVCDDKGRVKIDEHFATNMQGIYAIGDVVAGPMLAHKAEDEGIAVAEILAGKPGHVNYEVIPSVVYTFPEVAAVGKTEEELKQAGISYTVGRFPFSANSRARVNDEAEGFVKILADARTDRVLGVHMIGPDVGNMIGEAAIAMELGASAEDIARTCHAHPTLSEAIKEAGLAVDQRPIHI
jgi:dihydrolipoamide dehydrogenase